jgi:hypothetical protein
VFHTLRVQVSLRPGRPAQGGKYFEKIAFATFVCLKVFTGYLGLGQSFCIDVFS